MQRTVPGILLHYITEAVRMELCPPVLCVEQMREFVLPETQSTMVELTPSFGEEHLKRAYLQYI